MFNDDITPAAVDALCADLAAMLATEDALERVIGPTARFKVSGTVPLRAVELQAISEKVFLRRPGVTVSPTDSRSTSSWTR